MPGDRKASETQHGPTYSTQDVRQGDIVLRRHWQRIVFFGGLVAVVLLAVGAAVLS